MPQLWPSTKGQGILNLHIPLCLAHSWVRKPLKVHSTDRERRWTHSVCVRYLVDLLFLSTQITHICTGAQGCCEQTSVDYAGDENYITRTVGEPERKNTFGLNLCFMQGALICVWLKLGLCKPVNKAQSCSPYNESLRHGAHVGLAGSNFAQLFQIVLLSSIPVRKKSQWNFSILRNCFEFGLQLFLILLPLSFLVLYLMYDLLDDRVA